MIPRSAISSLLVLFVCWRSVNSIHGGGGIAYESQPSIDDDYDTKGQQQQQQHKSNNHSAHNINFVVGTGIYDMTGPAAQINFMGYAKSTQSGHGIHLRLRSRAFIVSEVPTIELKEEDVKDLAHNMDGGYDSVMTTTMTTNEGITIQSMNLQKEESQSQRDQREEESFLRWTARRKNILFGSQTPDEAEKVDSTVHHSSSLVPPLDPDRTICFVSIDAGMGSDLLNRRVLERLEALLPEQQTQNEGSGNRPRKRLCHLENLSISGTHTHSAPAGFLQYALYQITSYGFSSEVMDTYVESIAQSILRAYNNLGRGSIELANDRLWDANINRSPSSYLLNPQWERDLYQDEGDTDKSMVQLKFSKVIDHGGATAHAKSTSTPVGILNWFAVHGTSMNASNVLISGDNKGYAAYLMEKYMNGNETLPGQGSFVAAFGSTNLGDVSPNTAGPRCLDTGLPCDLITSTCNGRSALCVAFGPGRDMKESTEIIGRRQFEHSLRLIEHAARNATINSTSYLDGRVDFRQSFIDISNLTVVLGNGDTARTCTAALGYGFGAGTTDGPGMFDFTQGQNSTNPFWNIVSKFLSQPTEEQKQCHHPKPILLNTGKATLPYAWDPEVVPISVFRIGKLLILNLPCELTTMAGRRLRRAIYKIVQDKGGISDPEIVIAGLANSYTHYVTTFEEYAAQRYEAASTLYGPHTLSAYIQELGRLTEDLFEGRPSQTLEAPKDLGNVQLSLIEPVLVDMIGLGRTFGSVAIDVNDQYIRGADTVHVSFRSANPRNNQRIEDTFLTVDYLLDDGTWKTMCVDGDWSTKYVWKSDVDVLGVSFAEIYWTIPETAKIGTYRICHSGTRKTWIGDLEWLAYHVPDWLSLNMFGSMAGGLLLQVVRWVAAFTDWLDPLISYWTVGWYKDFHGCSSSFRVEMT